MSILYASLLAGLTPPASSADVIDADLVTNLGNAVNINADGTYTITGDNGSLPEQHFQVRLFDDSMADWHVQSPFNVYIGGNIRVPALSGTLTDLQTLLASLGLTWSLTYQPSNTVPPDHIIAGINVAVNDLITPLQTVQLLVSGIDPALYPEQYARLLPPGALTQDPDSTLSKLWAGVSTELQRGSQRADALLIEAQPSTTDLLLPDWEAEYDLPDACVTIDQTERERVAALVGRVVGVGGQSLQYYIDLAASMGLPIDIVEEHPFEVGRDGVGMGIGDNSWAHTWSVTVTRSTSQAERQLLECVFQRLKPAHTVPQFYYQ